jgi:hypothetical protein
MANRSVRVSIILMAVIAAASSQPAGGQSSGGSSTGAGTLVVTAPSKDGLIVAADSKMDFGNDVICDFHHKISEPNRPDRTVVAVAGASLNMPGPPAGVVLDCAYLRQAPRHFDINALAKSYLETSEVNVATMKMDQLAALCIETIAAFQKARGNDIRSFWGNRMFRVILANYEPAARRSTVKSFSLRLRANGEPFVSEHETQVTGPASPRIITATGETEFLQKQVMNGPGKQFLTNAYREWGKKTTIADIDHSLALNAAVDMIEAAAKTSNLPRSDIVIGGPVDAVLLGNQPRPQRLRWKTP